MRRLARSLVAVGGALTILIPAAANAAPPSFASADVVVGLQIKPRFASVTGACTGKIADTDGQTLSILVEGTAQSEGAAAATEISCTIYQDADGDSLYEAVGGCGATMPLNVAACAGLVRDVPFEPFVACAVATTYLLNGEDFTFIGPICPKETE